jgi:flagellar biosynthesis protein FlhF
MDVRTFLAKTMADALANVKRDLGVDAVILHARTYPRRSWLGLRRREVVEVTAGKGLNVLSDRRGRRTQGTPRALAPRARNRELLAKILPQNAAPPVLGADALMKTSGAIALGDPRELLRTPAAGYAALLGVSRDLCEVKTVINDLATQVRQGRCPDVPQELQEQYQRLLQLRIGEEIALDLVRTLRLQCRPEHLRQPQYTWERLTEQVEKLLPASGPIQRTKPTGPHVVALIGPTGVGKTTTLAKLAANLLLDEHRRVGLITMDNYRIAAVDQLRRYAEIIGSPVRAVASLEDLRQAMQDMENCEYILIDTAGRSPTDTMRLAELKRLLEAAAPDEVHLVLSMTSSAECAELAAKRFSDVRADKLILTKLDEAASLGLMLNLVRSTNRSLSYVTCGQDVPDDIECVGSPRLARLILGENP